MVLLTSLTSSALTYLCRMLLLLLLGVDGAGVVVVLVVLRCCGGARVGGVPSAAAVELLDAAECDDSGLVVLLLLERLLVARNRSASVVGLSALLSLALAMPRSKGLVRASLLLHPQTAERAARSRCARPLAKSSIE